MAISRVYSYAIPLDLAIRSLCHEPDFPSATIWQLPNLGKRVIANQDRTIANPILDGGAALWLCCLRLGRRRERVGKPGFTGDHRLGLLDLRSAETNLGRAFGAPFLMFTFMGLFGVAGASPD